MSRGKRPSRLVVLSAPSGSGKTTVMERLLKAEPEVVRSISMTTRPPRKGERLGRDYRFVTPRIFAREKAKGNLLECARILGHWYGTPLAPIRRALRQGRDVLLGIDIRGAAQIRRTGLPITTIFLLPPSLSALQQRLKRRGTETPTQIRARMKLALRELKEVGRFDYAVENDSLPEAIASVRAILRAQRCRVDHDRPIY